MELPSVDRPKTGAGKVMVGRCVGVCEANGVRVETAVGVSVIVGVSVGRRVSPGMRVAVGEEVTVGVALGCGKNEDRLGKAEQPAMHLARPQSSRLLLEPTRSGMPPRPPGAL